MLSVPQSGCESDFYQLHQSTLAIFGSLSQRILNSSANHQQNSANFLSPNGLKSRSKTCFWRHHDWDSGRLDLRAPDISRAQDQPYTPRPAVMIVGLHPPGWSECECLTASFKYIKMWDVVFWTWGSSAKRFQDIRFLQPFLTGFPRQEATKDGPANNCSEPVNTKRFIFVEFSQPFWGRSRLDNDSNDSMVWTIFGRKK